MSPVPRTMHQNATVARSVDPNGSGAKTTVPNKSAEEIRFIRRDA
jgi:hypothetical protein